ncbi:Lrp/AsnC family transcriptional regulator [Nanoarchaeota archaeon]
MVVNLDKADRRILFELDRNCRIPETKLAKIIGKSKESVRYRIKQLENKGVLKGYTIWIDPTKVGYTTAKIYLKFSNKPEQKKKFVEFVKRDKRLLWLGIAEGAWNAGLTYFVKSNREFFELKNELFSKFKDLILESYTGVLVDVSVHDKTFLYESETEWKVMFGIQGDYILDEVEKKILKELFSNARINLVDIARKYNSTIDIIRSRMKKLGDKGIIFRYAAKIDFNLLGYEFYKTFLYFKNLAIEDEKRLMNYSKRNPKIIHLVKQISPWDIELEIMSESYHDYLEIISDLTKEFSKVINKVETAIMGEDHLFPAKKMIFEN